MPHPKPSCEQIINIIPDPFVVIDKDYNIISANQHYAQNYGVTLEQVIGKKCHAVSHHSDVPCSRHGEHCPLESVFETGQPAQVIHVHYHQDGEEERVQLQANPIRDKHGKVIFMGEYIHPLLQSNEDELKLIGNSRALMRMLGLLQRVAPTQSTVLLLGESGTGKERIAHYLHHHSRRIGGPFVVVDCSTLGESLIESELFGHEKGSFTGANQRKTGLFEAAHNGTLFIDEIGDLPLPLQTKLLRVLESSTIRRIGGTEYKSIDVRVIAATHRNLQQMVKEGRFREDLYYRLSAFPVQIPLLCERKEDILALAEHFLSHMEEGRRFIPLNSDVVEALLLYNYPGNVRELRNIIERAAILAVDEHIRPEHIVLESGAPLEMVTGEMESPPTTAQPASDLLHRQGSRLSDEEVILALQQSHGHRARAAAMLGVSERTLYRYVQRMRSDSDA